MDLSGGDLTQKIIAGEYAVRNKLDACFLEKVDKNAMAIELGCSETEDQPVRPPVHCIPRFRVCKKPVNPEKSC